jgi:hypothetical protein
MLIWLDPSVLTADLSSDVNACHGVTAIFDAVYRGEHYAIGYRETLKALARNPHLSAATRSVISAVHSNLSTIGGISEVVSTKLVVTHNERVEPFKRADHQWEIPLRYLGVEGVRKAVILAEHLDDARVFEHAAKHYQAYSHISGRICFERVLGGGSTTPEVLSNLVGAEKRWCLCITDSDRLCPEDAMDLTARRCRLIAGNDHFVARHLDLLYREIENAVPLCFLNEAIPVTHKDLWAWHVSRFFALCPQAHRYCDIKLGTTRQKIYSYPAGSPKRLFWEAVLTTLVNASALTITCEEDDCPNFPAKKCDCNLTHGFGENLLDQILNFLDSFSPHNAEKRTRTDPLREQWLGLGRNVYEWGCAPAPMRS